VLGYGWDMADEPGNFPIFFPFWKEQPLLGWLLTFGLYTGENYSKITVVPLRTD
jgi:membrane-bound acyltransferase YfiQ involved in biofilm formation